MSSLARSHRRTRLGAAVGVPTVAVAAALILVPAGAAVATTPAPAATETPAPTATPAPTPVPNIAPPKASTGTADSITGGSARLTSTITGDGETVVQFEYGTSTSYGLRSDATTVLDAKGATVALPVAGLTVGTTYHFRVVAKNAAGQVQGGDRTFTTTSAPKAPVTTTQAASRITAAGAQLNARVSPQGQATTVRFDWGPTTAYGNTTATASAGSSRGTVSRGLTITSLAPGTTYHFRSVAQNASGSVVGKDRTFTTTRGLTSVSAALSMPVVAWEQSIAVSGSLAGAAPGKVSLELLRQDYPFNGAYRRIATTRTNAAGSYAFRLSRVYEAVRVRVRVIGSTTVQSPELGVGSELLVKLTVGVRKRSTTRLRGTIFPVSGTGAKARLQRQSPSGTWRNVRTLRLSAKAGQRASFRASVKRIGRTAAYRVVVDPRDGGRHALTISRSVSVAAKR
ncbi:MAG: hypothetical protein PGN13_12120 [Patulibacter minatonensis]